MISFNNLGKIGRLGNQLFQYVFLRTLAEKLNTTFYCPSWIGDEIFNLDDNHIRERAPRGILNYFEEDITKKYTNNIDDILDNTEISGYFISDKYFNNDSVIKWFSFKEDKVVGIKKKYCNIDFVNSVGVHLRFGDKLTDSDMNKLFYIASKKYYKKSLKKIYKSGDVIVFSDDINLAKKYLSDSKYNYIYIEGNKDWEDLYLMSQCRDFICAPSSLSFWGAWINKDLTKNIIFPKEMLNRPGSPYKNDGLVLDGWTKMRATRPIIDNYWVVAFPYYRFYYNYYINLFKKK